MFNKNGEKLSCNHGVWAWVIAILLGFILIVLVFKTGVIIGSMHSRTTFQVDDFKKFHTFETKKDVNWGKLIYASYKIVTSLTDSGFVVKDGDGKVQIVMVTEETKMIKGKEVVEDVKVGEKVYVDGLLNKDGQLQAKLVKIYDGSLDRFKK